MSVELKYLIEQKNEKLETMKKIIESAKEEKRCMSEEDIKVFNQLKTEVTNAEHTIRSVEEIRNIELNDAQLEKDDEKKTSILDEKRIIKKEIRSLADYIKSKVLGIQTRADNLDFGTNGAIIPTTIAQRIIEQVKQICPIYSLAEVYHIRGNLVVPYYGPDAGVDITCAYQAEFTDLTSKSGKFTGIELGGYLAGALTKVSKMLINSNDFGNEALINFVVKYMSEAIARFLESELLNGTGTNACQGIITGATNKTDISGGTGAITGDNLIALQETIPDQYQNGAVWIMNPKARAKIRTIKDTTNNYLLNPDLTAMWGYTLLGKPVYTTDNLAEGLIIYGNMTGLTVNIHEDINIEVLREHFAIQHAVGIVGWLEVDSKVTDQQKLAILIYL